MAFQWARDVTRGEETAYRVQEGGTKKQLSEDLNRCLCSDRTARALSDADTMVLTVLHISDAMGT